MCRRPFNSSLSTTISSKPLHNIMPSHPQQERAKRTVRFATETNICSIPSSLDQLGDVSEVMALWYDPQDLYDMRGDAKRTVEEMKVRQHASQSSSSNTTELSSRNSVLLAFDSETRGLESKVCIERQKRRCVTVRFVVSMANKLKNNSNVAMMVAKVCQRCTSYATEVAIEEAARDYLRAYHEEVFESMNFERYLLHGRNNEDIANNNKRRACDVAANHQRNDLHMRNVRQRTCTIY